MPHMNSNNVKLSEFSNMETEFFCKDDDDIIIRIIGTQEYSKTHITVAIYELNGAMIDSQKI